MEDFINRITDDIKCRDDKFQFADCVAYHRVDNLEFVNDGAYIDQHKFSCESDTFAFLAVAEDNSGCFSDWHITFKLGDEDAVDKWLVKNNKDNALYDQLMVG